MSGAMQGSVPEAALPQILPHASSPLAAPTDLPPHPLDAQWWMHAEGQTYGPFSGHQLKGFVQEGRLMPASQVRRTTGETWGPAAEEPVIGAFFRDAARPVPPPVTAHEGATVVQVTNHVGPHPAALVDPGAAAPKSAGTALLLSFLICGVGQMYNGQVGKGLLMLIGCVLLWFVLLGWAVWLWSVIDAYQTAKAMNLRYHQRLAAGYRA